MAVKKERLQRLQTRILSNAQRIAREMIGTIQTVLVEGVSKKDSQQLRGRTENNRVVNFDAPKPLIGQFVEVKITEALPNSLRGRLGERSLEQLLAANPSTTTKADRLNA